VRKSLGVGLVAFAAALWGFDQWIRASLSGATTATTIVFGEHVVLVLLTLPFAYAALRAVFKLGWRYVLAAIFVGAGASAVATILFTQALFAHNDFVTPVVLQKVQPVFAVIGAMIVLGERPRYRFGAYLVAALVGTWLMGVPDPFHPKAHGLATMAYALGAALLWALGTVFGRYLARDMRFEHVTTLRFLFGLAASAVALIVVGSAAFSSWHNTFWIAVLAVVTGFAAMFIYYYGLRSTPAVAATIAELAYPITAVLIGYFKFGQTLTHWQWAGVALTTVVVALLPARPRDAVELPAPVPVPA
jgi:drug/metabolite transporter (DMT)-like permease